MIERKNDTSRNLEKAWQELEQAKQKMIKMGKLSLEEIGLRVRR